MTLIHNGRALPKVRFRADCGARLLAVEAHAQVWPWPRLGGAWQGPGTSIGVFRPMSVMLDLAAFTGLRFGKPAGIR